MTGVQETAGVEQTGVPEIVAPRISGELGEASASRAEVCIVACAEAWRGDGEIAASPIGADPDSRGPASQGNVRA